MFAFYGVHVYEALKTYEFFFLLLHMAPSNKFWIQIQYGYNPNHTTFKSNVLDYFFASVIQQRKWNQP